MAEVGKLLLDTMTDSDPEIRNRSGRELVARASLAQKIEACAELEEFRRGQQN